MTWLTPVFDRTSADVAFALQKLTEWKQNPTAMYDLKGCLNASDINRILNNNHYLGEKLNECLYIAKYKRFDAVSEGTIFFRSDVVTMIADTQCLLDDYFTPINAPPLPDTLLSFEQVNALEENQHLLKEMIDDMISSMRECDTFESGEE